MNNQPKIEAYKSFYSQAKESFACGDIRRARECFLKASELANDISIRATSYNVRKEYHDIAVKILEFVQIKCVGSPKVVIGSEESEEKQIKAIEYEVKTAERKEQISFNDVAGLDDVKDEILFKVLKPMENPSLAETYKINAGGKILLYGPPGTGKTYIARAIAGEVDAKYYAVNCQDLISKYMGESSQQLEELFNEAQKNERAIIFFDEFDSVASKRSDNSDGVDAEMARFVATFLTKVDGFKVNRSCNMLLLIAATNRPWTIDSAMLRGGRFDTQIYVGLPDYEARLFLVKKALDNIPKDDDVELERLAEALDGYGGGDIMAICDKIKVHAYKRAVLSGNIEKICREDCNLAVENTRNAVSIEEMEKFAFYRRNGFIR